MPKWDGLLETYKEFLPVTDQTPNITLNEGNTPLIRLNQLSDKYDVDAYAKFDGLNPTGSFKDRGMVLAVAKAKEEGAHTVICASTGNTSAAAAAYAARAGLKAIVIIPQGKVAIGKLAQAIMYGAEIIEIEGNFDDALVMVRQVAEESEGIHLVNSVNPYRVEGQQTAAFEIIEELDGAPDYLTIPVGNAGNISAYWKGFKAYHEKHDTQLPKIYGYEAEGAAAISQDKVIDAPETIATAIRIGNPASWHLAVEARDESGGVIESVTDDEIIKAYQYIASEEGIFAEPGSAASVAGLTRALEKGEIPSGSSVVAVLTGNGLKDSDTAIDVSMNKTKKLPNDGETVISYIESLSK